MLKKNSFLIKKELARWWNFPTYSSFSNHQPPNCNRNRPNDWDDKGYNFPEWIQVNLTFLLLVTRIETVYRATLVGVLSNKIGKNKLKPGDHIYSWRHSYIYAHHGIYVGNGNVIHFTRGAGQEIGTGTVLDQFLFSSSPCNPSDKPCPRCDDQSKSDGVLSSCLDCFLSNGELYQFQYGVSLAIFLAKAHGGTCTLARSDPPEDVVHRAEYFLQNGFGGYNIFKNNCEDFAKFKLCKVRNVQFGKKGIPYINTYDGRTIRYPDPLIKANDTIKLDLETNKIVDFIKFDVGNVVMVTGGRNRGRVGVIKNREKQKGSFETIHVQDATGHVFATRLSNVYTIGKGTKPWVSLPKGKGIMLSIIEEAKKRIAAQSATA